MSTSNQHRIHAHHRDGIKKMLRWCVDKYKDTTGVNGKRMWRERIEFLARIQKEQFYTSSEQEILNDYRNKYLTEKFLDKNDLVNHYKNNV